MDGSDVPLEYGGGGRHQAKVLREEMANITARLLYRAWAPPVGPAILEFGSDA